MTDSHEQTPVPTTQVSAPTPHKKKRRIFMWVFLAVQVLFIVWIIAGLGGNAGKATDCGSLDQDTCETAEDVGASIGIFLVVILWMIVDFLMGVGYAVYRLARRP